MADLSLDEIIATQGLNPNITKPFQGRPGLPRAPPKTITPISPPKPSQPAIIQLKRAATAPGPKVNKPASPVVTKRAQTPNTAKPKNGQMDARDMISIKNRIKMGDARSKIIQKRMNRINAINTQLRPMMRPQFGLGPGGRCPVPGPGIRLSFPPPPQPGLGPPPRPLRPPGPQRFPPPGQGPPFQQPRPQQPRPQQHRPQQPPGMNQQRPPQFNPGQRPPFIRPRPPLNLQGPPMAQQNRPPFNLQQQPFNQQQRPPFNQQPPNFSQQPPNFNQQSPNLNQPPPDFSDQPPDFNQQPPDFNEQPDFNQPPPEFLQQAPDFIPEEPMGFMEPPPNFNQDQGPPLFQEQAMSFNAPDMPFGQQSQLGPGDPPMSQDGPPPFGQQGPPGQQMNPGGPQFSQPPPLMNQPPPNFSQSPPAPKVPPPNFNRPPPNQAFNPPPNLDQPPPNFNQRPPDVRQPPPGFGLPPPNLQQPPPGFHPMGDEEDGDDGFMTMGNGRTLVEDTGTSLKITRTIPEVSFDGQSLTVTRRVPEGGQFEGNMPVQMFTPRAPAVHPNPPPPKMKFQPVPVKAPSPAPRSNIVKTGGPTLNKKANNGNQPPAPRRNPGLVQNSMPPPSRPGPNRAGNSFTNTHMASMKTETVPSAAPITRTLHIPPQQPPPRLNPPQSAGSVFSRIQLPSQSPRSNPPPPSSGSVFSRIQLPPQTVKPAPRVQQSQGEGNVMSRLSAPVPITKRLAPPSIPPPQPARVPQVSSRVPQVSGRVPQVSTRVAVKRPAAMSLSERFSSGGGSGNPIPVITDHSSLKKRRASEPEDVRADFGRSFQSESVPEGMTEQQDASVTLLSPLQGYRVLVSNLHSTVTQDDVIELFGALGPLKRANLLTKGQAELAFIHKEHALLALKTYHNRELDGQPMFVKLTTPLNAKVMQPSDDSPPIVLPPNLRSKKPPTPSSAPVEIPLIHKALFKTATDGAPPKAVRFTVKL